MLPAWFLVMFVGSLTPGPLPVQIDPGHAYASEDECKDAAIHKAADHTIGDQWKSIICLPGFVMR